MRATKFRNFISASVFTILMGILLINTAPAYAAPTIDTTTTINSNSPASPKVGNTVTFNVSVTGDGSATPTGTVTVADGGLLTCTTSALTDNAGTAIGSCDITVSAANEYIFTATYSGDDAFITSDSVPYDITVDKADPILSITNSPLTYNRSAQAPVVTGSVPGTVSNLEYGGSTTTPTAAGSYVVTANFIPDDTTNYNSLVSAPAGTFVIAAKPLTITGVSASNKVYDGNTDATLTGTGTLVGVVSGDTVSLDSSGAIGTFADPGVDTGIHVTASGYTLSGGAGNYSLTQPTGLTADITAKPLTITGVSASNKVYDHTTDATLTGTPALAGVVSPDEVNITGTPVASFLTAAVGTGKTVTVSGYTLGGSDPDNYSLTQPADLTADITAKPLTITGVSVSNKVFDRTTNASLTGTASLAGIVSPDVVTLDGSPVASFLTAAVGKGKPVTVTGYTLGGANAGNYSLTQPAGLTADITAKPLTITGVSASNKVFDGTTTTTLTGTPAPVGVVSPDVVTITGTPVGNFLTADVGTAKAVTVTGFTLGGANAGNYSLTQPTGLTADITKAEQVINFTSTAPANASVNGATYTPIASGGASGNPIVFTIDVAASSICSITAGQVSFQSVGSCVIDANQAANTNYNPAAQVQQSFTVGPQVLSNNADLSALVLSSGSLNPAFTPSTIAYTASVGNSVTSLTVTPTLADLTASVMVNGTAVTSGSASTPISLNVGPNTITIIVTAQDSTTKTTTIIVTRAPATLYNYLPIIFN